jgi:hypothetical protein
MGSTSDDAGSGNVLDEHHEWTPNRQQRSTRSYFVEKRSSPGMFGGAPIHCRQYEPAVGGFQESVCTLHIRTR